MTDCMPCPDGSRTNVGLQVSCTPCPVGRYEDIYTSITLAHELKCVTCPPKGSATCDNGNLQLNVGAKYWAPPLDMYLWDDAAEAWLDSVPPDVVKQKLNASMDVFKCLGLGLGCANSSGNATTQPAFVCTEGYSGALCASCDAGRFFKRGECVKCQADETLGEKIDDSSSVIAAVLIFVAVILLARKAIKRKAKKWLRMIRRWRRRQRNLNRRKRKRQRQKLGPAVEWEWEKKCADRLQKVPTVLLKALRNLVKSVQDNDSLISESVRILLGFAQVIFHMCGALRWCIHWPRSLGGMLAVFGWLSFDAVEEVKVPCHVVHWNHFSKVFVAVLAPLAIVVLIPALVIPYKAVALRKAKRKGQKLKLPARFGFTVVTGGGARGGGRPVTALHVGALASIGIVTQLLDVLYPTITRTITAAFVCRKLGPAGFFMESDYSLKPVRIYCGILL